MKGRASRIFCWFLAHLNSLGAFQLLWLTQPEHLAYHVSGQIEALSKASASPQTPGIDYRILQVHSHDTFKLLPGLLQTDGWVGESGL